MKTGFSLVELSIVLVILGLLTGGILTGQNLIKAAELRSVTKEYDAFQTATNIFRDKYLAIPGDMNNAGRFWGYATTGGPGGTCTAPTTDVGTGTQTCDGNGDGSVSLDWSVALAYEQFRFWEHLTNAGLIEGEYTGIQTPGSRWHSTPGSNIPKSKFNNGGWGRLDSPNYSGDAYWLDGNYNNFFSLGAYNPNDWAGAPFMTPEDIWNIDMKMDDGKPGMGRLITTNWNGCSTAATSADWAAAVYDLPLKTRQCVLFFMESKFH